MSYYDWSKIIAELSDNELFKIISDERTEPEEKVSAAINELKNRGIDTSINAQDLSSYTDEKILEVIANPDKWRKFEIDNAYKIAKERNLQIDFPEKPHFDLKKPSFGKSFLSFVVFIAAFFLIFDWDIKYIIVITVVLLIHELGHFIAMKIYNYKDLNIFFIPLIGAIASGTKNTISQKQNAIILLAGPLPGVIIGTMLLIIGHDIGNKFLFNSASIFITLNLFNLLPIIPLDGGRLIKTLFFESNATINKIFLLISIVVMILLAIYLESYFLLIIPFFLIGQLSIQSSNQKIIFNLKAKGVEMDKTFDELTNREYWLIRDEIGLNNKYLKKFIEPKKYVVSDNEKKIINQVKEIIQKKPIKDLKVGGKILFLSTWLISFIIPFVLIALYYFSLNLVGYN